MLTREQLIDRLIAARAENVAWRRVSQRSIEPSEADISNARATVEAALLTKRKPSDELRNH